MTTIYVVYVRPIKNFISKPALNNPSTGKKAIPKMEYQQFSIGENSEAVVYVQEHIHLWKEATPLVMELEKL